MLPRKKAILAMASVLAVVLLGTLPVQPAAVGFTRVLPKVNVQEFKSQDRLPVYRNGAYVFNVLSKFHQSSFSLVGVTWTGSLRANTQFTVKVHEANGWSDWQKLSYSVEHAPDGSSREAKLARHGTDPLITAPSDGVIVRVLSKSKKLPKGIKVALIDSPTTSQDLRTFNSAKTSAQTRQSFGTVITKSGAVVNRPNIVTRAQWGADESWRDKTPRISSKIIAGFVHHTATTNSYDPSDGPAQMRDLYAYFTKSLKYADMGYNFLVDRYGVVYEGRAGCSPTAAPGCDGPSRAVIGAHTAGMNDNTFAISAIGNFQTGKLDTTTANLLTNSISSLMAWKIAPYNLDPAATVRIPSTDTSGLSKYRKGTVATVLVISGHRDVGRTVCPGQYLYAHMQDIRNRISGLLAGKIRDVDVTPTEQLASDLEPITISAQMPVTGSWSLTVRQAETGSVVFVDAGTQKNSSNFEYNWNHLDSEEKLLPAGNYAVSITATVADQQLPTETVMLMLGAKPLPLTGLHLKRVSNYAVHISWPLQPDSLPQVDDIQYRTSATQGRTWTMWHPLPSGINEKTITSSFRKRKIYIEFKQRSALGESSPTRLSFISKS